LGNPNYVPDIKEGLAAVKMLHEIKSGAEDTGVTQGDLYVMVTAFMEATQAVLNKHAPGRISAAMADLGILLDRNPELAKLVSKTTVTKAKFTVDEYDPDEEDDEEIAVAELVSETVPVNPINERDED
jgi:hypothetical protein